MNNSLESELLASPATVWRETIRLETEFAVSMKRIRYASFAAEWRKGKTVDEVAKALNIPLSHAAMVVVRARSELGDKLVPRRNKLKRLAK